MEDAEGSTEDDETVSTPDSCDAGAQDDAAFLERRAASAEVVTQASGLMC